jgi:predicted 3-demethylubiquinone-9 3-methyltransferase (glyoxalase superfamily)
MKVTQHLWFEKDMEAAIGFYTSLVRGSSVDWVSTLPADTPSGPAGSVKIGAFTLGDQHYMAIEAGPLDPFNHSFSIMVECDTAQGPGRADDGPNRAKATRVTEARSRRGTRRSCQARAALSD